MAIEWPAYRDSVFNFGLDVDRVLSFCFTNEADMTAQMPADKTARLRAVVEGKVTLEAPQSESGQTGLASLRVHYKLCTDSYDNHLAVENSSFELKADLERAPIIRWDYDREARSKPSSHVQVTAHRGALSHLLSQLHHKTPHSIESLHIPTGGGRFRPCLEDIAEFLISDCGFVGRDGWSDVVRRGRAKWRRLQIRSAVRDAPGEAAAALRSLGYEVHPPDGVELPERADRLTAW
ncbi:hypothetical protein BH11ACT7_BH11ACT7_33400 [soil metagenome]